MIRPRTVCAATIQAVPATVKSVLVKQGGQTLIEMALGLPLLCMMLFGFINFALVMYQLANITYASHAAARYASVHSLNTASPATTTSITGFLGPFLPSYPSNTVNVAVSYPATGANSVGGTVQIVVTLTYAIALPFYTLNGLQVSSTAQAAITV